MTLQIDPDTARERIDEFLDEIDDLLGKRYAEGKDEKRRMSTRLDNFAKVAFSDGEEKKNSLYPSVATGVLGGKSERRKQKDYEESLKRKKNHLEAWKEQIDLEEGMSSTQNNGDDDYQEIEEEISNLTEDLPLYANDLDQSLDELRSGHFLASVLITGRVIDSTLDQIKSSQRLGGPEEVLDHLEDDNIVDPGEGRVTEAVKLYRDEYTHEVGKAPEVSRTLIVLLGCTELLHNIQKAGKSEEYNLV